MINYKPEDAVRVWPEGDYQATLETTEETTSQAGNPMLTVTFKAYDGSGTMTINDYIVIPAFTWKLKKLAEAFGAGTEFEAGTFDPNNYAGKNLTLKIGIQPAKDGFDERNRVAAYDVKSNGKVEEEDVDALFG